MSPTSQSVTLTVPQVIIVPNNVSNADAHLAETEKKKKSNKMGMSSRH